MTAATDNSGGQAIGPASEGGGPLALLDWRRRVFSLYAAIRSEPDPERAWTAWRAGRDRLFRTHPQSPLDPEERPSFGSLPFFHYEPTLRLVVGVVPADGPRASFEAGEDGVVHMRPIARTEGLAPRLGGELTLFWLLGYGGGLFLPFADATSGQETYGAGRYLLDTIKGADLGGAAPNTMLLDFNFAYNPSCCYSPRYICPLAPPINRLPRPVRAGEVAWGVESLAGEAA